MKKKIKKETKQCYTNPKCIKTSSREFLTLLHPEEEKSLNNSMYFEDRQEIKKYIRLMGNRVTRVKRVFLDEVPNNNIISGIDKRKQISIVAIPSTKIKNFRTFTKR